jgi:dCTP deaminase
MLMSDSEIKSAMESGELEIGEYYEHSLQAASYDARVGARAILGGTDKEINIEQERSITLRPGDFILIVTRERFKLNEYIAGNLGLRSYYGRKGLVVLAGLQIDPGFEGHLVIGAYNAAPRRLVLEFETPFLTVEFHRLSKPAAKPFVSDEEHKQGKIPRMDKDYLRTLETQSLSQVAEELRTLTINVSIMHAQLKLVTWIVVGTFVAALAAATVNFIFP